MNKYILVAALLAATCANAGEWTPGEKAAFGFYVVLSAIDAAQTSSINNNPKYAEANKLFADGDNVKINEMIAAKIVYSGLFYWQLNGVNKGDKMSALLFVILLQGAIVANNHAIGVTITF